MGTTREEEEEIGGGGRIGRASFGHIDRLMIAWNKGQTVTWSRGRVMDRFRRGGAPRRRPARLHSTPAGLGEAAARGRQTTRINQRETERPGVPAPGVIRLFASLIPRAPPTYQKNSAARFALAGKSDSSNLFSIVANIVTLLNLWNSLREIFNVGTCAF